jgi:hypothetical protein
VGRLVEGEAVDECEQQMLSGHRERVGNASWRKRAIDARGLAYARLLYFFRVRGFFKSVTPSWPPLSGFTVARTLRRVGAPEPSRV